MDEARIAAALDSLLTPEERLRGPDTTAALALLDRPEVADAFARVSRALALDEDACDEDVALVDRAHVARVAVAIRWGRGGSTAAEREVAARVDRRLSPHRDAVLCCETGDLAGWLEDAWIDGAEVDEDSWWGFGLSPSWIESGEIVERGLVELAGRQAFEPRDDRHEAAWTAHLLEHGHPNDRYFYVATDYDGVPRYGMWCRDWPECEMDDLADEWARTFERWGRNFAA